MGEEDRWDDTANQLWDRNRSKYCVRDCLAVFLLLLMPLWRITRSQTGTNNCDIKTYATMTFSLHTWLLLYRSYIFLMLMGVLFSMFTAQFKSLSSFRAVCPDNHPSSPLFVCALLHRRAWIMQDRRDKRSGESDKKGQTQGGGNGSCPVRGHNKNLRPRDTKQEKRRDMNVPCVVTFNAWTVYKLSSQMRRSIFAVNCNRAIQKRCWPSHQFRPAV